MVLIILNYDIGSVDIIRNIPDDIEDTSDLVYNTLGYKESEISWMIVDGEDLIINNWKFDLLTDNKVWVGTKND